MEKQVGCTRMEGETRSGHLYRKPLYMGDDGNVMMEYPMNPNRLVGLTSSIEVIVPDSFSFVLDMLIKVDARNP